MKLDRTEKQIVRCAHFLNHTIYVCDVHRLFSNKDGNNKCPYCKKECKEIKEEDE